MKRILVTGALGQIGSLLVEQLRTIYGISSVIAADIRNSLMAQEEGPFEKMDVTEGKEFSAIAKRHNVDTIIHLASILSAKAEFIPLEAWRTNMTGLLNGLEIAREMDLQFFTPSSIAAFGHSTPKENTPQLTIQRPITMYGINKTAGELLCDYYFKKYGMDTRGIRFPGIISHNEPGGGTTDYAVEIYHAALERGAYTSYLKKDTTLDMMYIPDALDAIIQLMETDSNKLKNRNAYNISSFAAAPKDFAQAIRKHIPHFQLDYKIDPIRQKIADSWPNQLDCTAAKREWGFQPKFDLEKTTEDMFRKIKEK
ncbi:NAD-dependent epimerase/dehydratase family protein [Oceanobacillus caeni]|uniref:UDP-glucose 4-epimerase n=1 Tax=Oceanobacillus caeni TaxID=405946 RepID=A0ABR5MID1_9BACI|nr:NAD-dependent epimerase/dehydratase family protein [Oceanobacillus caeni]KPH74283.1 UDP-glucose 4-epimerase [Oceanobacillus caeni]